MIPILELTYDEFFDAVLIAGMGSALITFVLYQLVEVFWHGRL